MRRHSTRRSALATLSDPLLVGAVLLVCGAVGMYLSYNSSRGLPFVPSYRVSVEVPDAAELTKGVSEVRIGSSRVGLVRDVDAVPARGGRPPFARLKLDLTRDVEPLPVNSAVRVRPRSPLGAKYLDLDLGSSRRGIPAGGTLPLSRARPAFEFDEAFETFGPTTRRGLHGTVTELGDALAGRGTTLNETLATTRRLLPPAQRIARGLGSPGTELGGFLEGAAQTTGALAEVAPALGSLVEGGTTTLDALDAAGGSLGRYLEELPPTELVATRTLAHARPVITDAAAIARAARGGTALLPESTKLLERSFAAGMPSLRALNATFRLPGGGRTRVALQVERLVRAARALSEDRATRPAVSELDATVASLRTTLGTLAPAQLQCNVGGLWARNLAGILGGGSGEALFNFYLVLDIGGLMLDQDGRVRGRGTLTSQHGIPDRLLHFNAYPNEDATECESGNEPYQPLFHIGNPSDTQPASTEETHPPPGVADLARQAGLLSTGGQR